MASCANAEAPGPSSDRLEHDIVHTESPVRRRISPSAGSGTSQQHTQVPLDSEARELDLGPAAMGDPDSEDIADLESSIIQQSRTIEDFTRIIAEWRTERERVHRGDGQSTRTSVYGAGAQAGEGSSSQAHLRVRHSVASLSADAARSSFDVDTMSQCSYEASSVGDPDEARFSPSLSPSQSPLGLMAQEGSANRNAVRVRCTCCCGRGTRRCKRARRATREWSQVESDLRLAAQIGQALLRRSDALQSELTSAQEEHGSRINSMMKKLSSSIKEAGQLEKRLEQSELNLEACEASNRALVRELDECRRDLSKARGSTVRNSGLEVKLERAEREAEDLRQELAHEKKRTEQAKAKARRAEKLNTDLSSDLRLARLQGARTEVSEEERARRKNEVRKMVEMRLSQNGVPQVEPEQDSGWIEALVTENDSLSQENKQMKELLVNRNDEIAQLRDELNQKQEYVPSSTSPKPDIDQANPPLRLSDFHPPMPTALSEEIIDTSVRALPPSHAPPSDGQQTPALLSPQMATASLPSAAGSTTSIGTVTETTSEATSHHDPVKSTKSSGGLQPTLSSSNSRRETRTAQLIMLIDTIQRLSSRLSTADVDTMAKRLQRQKLAGDVGHLARTTVNGILRDVDGLREHFRRSMDSESKGRETDAISLSSRTSGKSDKAAAAESESLVARKEFFALIKVFKDLFVEMARLRNAINEVTLQPQHAVRILQEQLGVQMTEDKGVGAWFGRLLSTTGLPGTGAAGPALATTSQSSSNAPTAGTAGLGLGQGAKPSSSRTTSNPQLGGALRASAAAMPTAVAVEVKGMHAAEQSSGTQGGEGSSSRGTSPQPDQSSFEIPSHARPEMGRRQPSLSRVQSRNLSGLFAGSFGSDGLGPAGMGDRSRVPSEQSLQGSRLSRIVDDDEVSIHQGNAPRARTLRPRNLSDSSMHTTFLDDEPDDDFQTARARGSARKPRTPGLMAAATPTPAAISRVITPSTLSLQASHDGQTSPSAGSGSGGGLLGNLGPPRSVARAFGLLSTGGANAAPAAASTPSVLATLPANGAAPTSRTTSGGAMPPILRGKSSRAQLSLAAATASASGETHVQRNIG